MIRVLIYITFFICTCAIGQNYTETELSISSKNATLNGTLLKVNSEIKTPLVILIPGSGPTDRNGNSMATKNNSLKFLAEALTQKGISSFRYDKSVLSFTEKDKAKIDSLQFEDFIADSKAVIEHFRTRDKFSKIIIAGHSQGSLVGLIASENKTDGFISIAGAGKTIDKVITEQITKQAPFLVEDTKRVLSELKKGNTIEDFNPSLASLFNKQVQPFLISWIKYNPQEEIKKLTIPVLIINGSKDIQVKNEDAKLLHQANPTSKLVLIENMNHLFKEINGDLNENLASYNNPELPVMNELIESITTFINELK
jgi:pimeloyl-ACP methyl ester carboxylesterase